MLGGQNPQKLSKIGPNRHFAAKSAKSWSSHISVIDEAIRVEFDRQIENKKKYPKSAKLGQKGSCGGHVTQFRLKLETSILAGIRAAVSSNEENAKLGQKGSCGGHVTQFWNFGTPLISRERLKLESSNLARILAAVRSN